MADTVESLELDIAKLKAQIADLEQKKATLLDPPSNTPEAKLATDLFNLFGKDEADIWFSEFNADGTQVWEARVHAKYLLAANRCIETANANVTRRLAPILAQL